MERKRTLWGRLWNGTQDGGWPSRGAPALNENTAKLTFP
jgi:hypothetical protein